MDAASERRGVATAAAPIDMTRYGCRVRGTRCRNRRSLDGLTPCQPTAGRNGSRDRRDDDRHHFSQLRGDALNVPDDR